MSTLCPAAVRPTTLRRSLRVLPSVRPETIHEDIHHEHSRSEKSRDPLITRTSARALARQRADAKLQQLEDTILASILDRHPEHDDALSRLVNDIEALPADRGSTTSPTARLPWSDRSFTPHQLEHMQQLLVAVALGAHQRRDRALNSLLNDINDEERERAEFDISVDNDPDGLG